MRSHLTLSQLKEAQRLLDESPSWTDSEEASWMELPTILGGLLVEVVPKTKEIISVKWQT